MSTGVLRKKKLVVAVTPATLFGSRADFATLKLMLRVKVGVALIFLGTCGELLFFGPSAAM